MKLLQKLILALFFLNSSAHAFEMIGLVTYNMSQVAPQPNNYVESSNGIGYAFFGRLDLGPGLIESGFLYTPTSITTSITPSQNITTKGSYWIFPLMYRYVVFPPFLSIAAGLDYALVGNNEVLIGGSALTTNPTSGYKSHFGYEISAEASQDLGENLSAVLDVRYRGGLGNAIYYTDQEVSKYSFWIIALGIQKHLD